MNNQAIPIVEVNQKDNTITKPWKGIGFRWYMLALLMIGTMINYIDRNALGALSPIIKNELNLSTQEYSWIIASFQAAYTLCQPVAGYLIDFVGVKFGFFGACLMWGISASLHAFSGGWRSMAIFRGMLGVSEAAAMPSNVKVVTEWFPVKERSIAAGMFNCGPGLGALIATPLSLWIAMHWGWKISFFGTGLLGIGMGLLWITFYKNIKDKSRCSDAEREYILSGQPKVVTQDKASLKSMLGRRQLWGIAIARFLSEPAWQTFTYWIPLYMVTVKGMDIKSLALFGWLPFLGADIGSLVGGFLSPFFMKHFKMTPVNSRIASVAVGAICMVGPAIIGFVADSITAIFLFALGGFAQQCLSASLFALTTDTFKENEVATSTGFTGMCAYLGGTIFTLCVGALADTIGYEPAFFCLFLFDIIAAIALWALVGEWGGRISAVGGKVQN